MPFGLLVGVAAAGFVRALYWFEDRFDGAFGNAYLRHMAGMLVVGIMIQGLFVHAGEYYIAGVGYATITDILRDVLTNPLFLLLLFAAKLLATCLTLGLGRLRRRLLADAVPRGERWARPGRIRWTRSCRGWASTRCCSRWPAWPA
ncbi:MAG: chloride channel protein [Halofilum sp. (in: g-proteobacteria)]|nr:chloride channel protein [Halofilum sp. (in: g-proteobacteria)]